MRKWQIMIKYSLPRWMFTFSWKPLPVEQHWWLDKELRNMQMNLGKGLPCQPCPRSFFSPHTHTVLPPHSTPHLTHAQNTHCTYDSIIISNTFTNTPHAHPKHTSHSSKQTHTHTTTHLYIDFESEEEESDIWAQTGLVGWATWLPGQALHQTID